MRYAALAIGLVLLAGCGADNVLTEGEVVDKWLDPGHYYTTVICTGSPSVCIPYQYFDDTDYYVVILGDHDDETVTESHSVSDRYWNEVDMGDWWEQ